MALSPPDFFKSGGKYPWGIRATVLKVPHHGSSNSICHEFAAAVQPQYAVISTGKNTFGHPDRSTILFWQEHGARVLRTDIEGEITFYYRWCDRSVSKTDAYGLGCLHQLMVLWYKRYLFSCFMAGEQR